MLFIILDALLVSVYVYVADPQHCGITVSEASAMLRQSQLKRPNFMVDELTGDKKSHQNSTDLYTDRVGHED